MPLIILTAALAGLVLALSSLEPALQRSFTAFAGASLMLAAALAPQARRALSDLVPRHWPTLCAVALWLGYLAYAGHGARGAIFDLGALLGLVLAAGATAAIAKTYGRALLAVALLLTALPVAFAILLTQGMNLGGPLGRLAPDQRAPGLLAGFGALVIVAAHIAADELRRRRRVGEPKLAPLAQRLFAPIASYVTCVSLMSAGAAAETLGAAAIGLLVFAAALWPRARRSRVGGAIMPPLVIAAIAAAAIAMLTGAFVDRPAAESSGVDPLLAHFGAAGLALAAASIAILTLALALAKDRGRQPSRGMPLLLAASAYALIASWYTPGLAAPSAAFVFALVAGLAASYLDDADA